MSSSAVRTEPDHSFVGWPKGIPYIIGNEACERFSFYGMKAILYVFLAGVYVEQGMPQELAKNHSTEVVHLFIVGVYFLPMIGAVISDRLLGKYWTILSLSIVYCLGHACLAIFENNINGFYVGLGLIAVGSGGIKPCVSAHVGDQFGRGNWFRLQRVYQIFYFSINFGSFFSTLLIPWVNANYGPGWAFGIPGILMAIATFFFWMGRHVFIHVPAKPGGKLGALDAFSGSLIFTGVGLMLFPTGMTFLQSLGVCALLIMAGLGVFFFRQGIEQDDGFLAVFIEVLRNGYAKAEEKFDAEAAEGVRAVLRIMTVYLMVSVFWALFDQHSSTWIRQAQMMDRVFELPFFGTITALPSQIGALNPVMVMMLIPFTAYFMYPLIEKLGFEMTPLRRMSIGMFMASAAFAIVALVQTQIETQGEGVVHVGWQIIPYLVMTLSEVMVSITGLEFGYSQAPKRMKSTIMGLWLMTVALGNKLVAFLATFESLSLTNFFWVFAGLMAIAAAIFSIRAATYTYRDYTQ